MAMDLNDFKGLSYFRFLVPSMFIACWLGMILGPIFITLLYREFCFLVYVYFFVKTTYQLVLMINVVIKANAALERAKNQDKQIRPIGLHYQ